MFRVTVNVAIEEINYTLQLLQQNKVFYINEDGTIASNF